MSGLKSKRLFIAGNITLSIIAILIILFISQSILFYFLGLWHQPIHRGILSLYGITPLFIGLGYFIFLIYNTYVRWVKMNNWLRLLRVFVFLLFILGVYFYNPIFSMYGRGFKDSLKCNCDIIRIQKWILSQELTSGKTRTINRLEWPDYVQSINAICVELRVEKSENSGSFNWDSPLDYFVITL